MVLHPKQNEIAEDTHRFRVLRCGRRFGKTILACEEIKGVVLSKPSYVTYFATTYQQARDIAWETLKKELKPVAITINESRLEMRLRSLKGGESVLQLRGWEAIESERGKKNDFLVLDEVASYRNFWIGWQEVLRPTLTDTRGEALFPSTPKGYNHFYDLCNLELKDDEWKSFHYTSWDNPFLPTDELEKAKASLPPERFAQEYEASFQKTEGLVYKEFSRQKHLYDKLPSGKYEKLGGIDFGFRNPAAILTCYFDGEHIYVEDEWYKRERTDAQIAEYAAGCGFDAVFPDPESAGGIEELRQHYLNVREVIKGKGSVEGGIQKIRELLIRGALKVNRKCTNLISEFEMYSYEDVNDERNEKEQPIKANDHACFTKDVIMQIPLGQILQRSFSGHRDVYEFMGSKVTSDHPYLTPRGFVRLDSLRYSDRIVTWKNSLLTELSLDDTQTQRGVSFGSILYLLQRNVLAIKQNAFTDIYGNNILVKYLMGIIYTTKTATHLTTLYLISNVYHHANTTVNTMTKCYRNGVKILKRKLNQRQFCGINLQKGAFSINGLVESLGETKCMLLKLVRFVRRNTKHRTPKGVNTATIIAGLKHLGKEDVYAVATSSGFFTANNVVVSNCDALRYVVSTALAVPAIQHEQREYFERNMFRSQMNETL